MPTEAWLYTLLFGVAGLHLLVVLLAYRFKQAVADSEISADSPEPSTQSSTVTCPRCDAANERSYSYCAHCVSKLPAGTTPDSGASSPTGREIF